MCTVESRTIMGGGGYSAIAPILRSKKHSLGIELKPRSMR